MSHLTIYIWLILLVCVSNGEIRKRRTNNQNLSPVESSIFHRQKRLLFNKCANDYSATAPYQIPVGQSPVVYVPNVTLRPPYSTCAWVPHSYPTNPEQVCPSGSQIVLTTFVPLILDPILTANAKLAQVSIQHDVDNPSTIIQLQSLITLHCTLNYFTCYNDQDINTIKQVLANYQWSSFEITINNVSCDTDTVQTYIVAEADQTSSNKMWNFVHGLESAIQAAGVAIKQPRIERFHMTLATVKYQYPSDCMVKKLNQKFLLSNQFGSVKACCFGILGSNGDIGIHFAQDCSESEKLTCAH